MSDATLLVRIASGDTAALVTLYDRYASLLLPLANHILSNDSEAEELVHDVFLDVWQHAACYGPEEGTVRTWLILRTRKMGLDLLHSAPEIADQSTPPAFAMSDWSLRHVKPRNHDRQITQERLVVQQTLTHLNEDQRSALEWAFFRGSPELEIGEKIGLPVSMLRTGWSEAQQDLHQALFEIRKET